MSKGMSLMPSTDGCKQMTSSLMLKDLSLEWIGVSFLVLWEEIWVWISWCLVLAWVGVWKDEEYGGVGGRGGWWMASHALRFAFFSLNWHMSTSCFCFEASKSAFLFLHNFSICAQISYIVDVSALVERANELEPPLLVATIFLWPKEKFSLAPRWAPNVLAKF